MKATQFAAKIFKKNGEEYTEITVGINYASALLEDRITILGGRMVKQTKLVKQYEIKGNQLQLVFARSI